MATPVIAPHADPTCHVIVASADAHDAARCVLALCALVEVTGHGPCRPVVQVRGITEQGRLFR